MKRVGKIFDKMISDENIGRAIDEVNKSHRWQGRHKGNKLVAWIELTKPERIEELRQIIIDGFEPTEPVIKRRYDKSARKWRDISEPRLYPDQYVHHILIQAIEPVMLKKMDPFCCGSIRGRGTSFGTKAIKKWMKNDRKGTRWCMQLDIHHFYDSLTTEEVMRRMRQLIKDWRVLDLIERILKYGVLIGGFFSQWFANTVLQPLDVLIRQCGVSHYVRYMDNFTIFSNTKKTLRKVKKTISKWLTGHALKLKGDWQIFKTRRRLPDALGYRFGHTYTLIRKRRLLDIKRQITSYFRQKQHVSAKFAMALLSRISGLTHCNNRNIFRDFIPKGLQKKLKNVVREYQRKELIEWSTFLESQRAAIKIA